jgi:hypothetical protein
MVVAMQSEKHRAAIDAMNAAAERVTIELPEDVIDSLLSMGRVEWGTSLHQTDEKHVEDMRDTLRITREYFNTEAEETAIHGVYLEGTNTVLAHTGNSPNSPQHARILVGAWNQLVDVAAAARFPDSRREEELIEAAAKAGWEAVEVTPWDDANEMSKDMARRFARAARSRAAEKWNRRPAIGEGSRVELEEAEAAIAELIGGAWK